MPAVPLGLRSARGPLVTLVGFAASLVMLAAVALLAVPAMISASGPRAWGAIATGQSIGAVAAVVLYLGWGISGPAVIARVTSVERGRLYAEALVVRLAVAVPVLAVASAITALVARSHVGLAILGSISAATIGLGAGWYFIGTAAPFRLLVLETVPRVTGTVIGIVAMRNGATAAAGLWGQLLGMLVAVVLPSVWIYATTRGVERWTAHVRPVRTVLREQVAGVATTTVAATYVALPVVIVGLTSTAALPAFAVLDKLQKQLYVSATPMISVLQGWVPRATPARLRSRIHQALVGGAAVCLALAVAIFVATPWLVDWLSAGHVSVEVLPSALIAAIVATNTYESVVSRGALVPLGRLRYASQVTACGSVIGLALIPPATLAWGATGALAAMLTGLVIRVVAGLLGVWTTRTPAPGPTTPPHDLVETMEVAP